MYREELEAWAESGSLKLFTAFSRKEGVPKTYVQHAICEQASEVAGYLKRGAHIYVCGDASRMAPAVKVAFAEVASDGNLGDTFISQMVAESRYCEDVWAAQSLG